MRPRSLSISWAISLFNHLSIIEYILLSAWQGIVGHRAQDFDTGTHMSNVSLIVIFVPFFLSTFWPAPIRWSTLPGFLENQSSADKPRIGVRIRPTHAPQLLERSGETSPPFLSAETGSLQAQEFYQNRDDAFRAAEWFQSHPIPGFNQNFF